MAPVVPQPNTIKTFRTAAAFERWLAPDNFNAQGQQKASLSSLNAV